MKKQTLVFDLDYDYTIIGISCHFKDYRLCHFLNKVLKLDLKKMNDHIVTSKNNTEPKSFSFYKYASNNQELNFYLVANRGEQGFLIAEHKQADYLFIVENIEEDIDHTLNYEREIKTINGILTTYSIDYDSIKNKSNLIFE